MQEFFDRWLDTSGYGCCDLFDVVRSWWTFKDEPNVLLVHYRQLKEDLRTQTLQIAEFISIDPGSLRMATILEHCSFGYMRARAEPMVPFGGEHMANPKAFFDKGPERDYRAELTAKQIEKFDRLALEKLGRDCAAWLETGDLPAQASVQP